MRKHMLVGVLIIFLVLTGCVTLPKLSGKITGFVYLPNTSDHSGVKVLLSELNTSCYSDKNGMYSFRNIGDKDYTLIFSKEGYSTVTKVVQAKNGQTVEATPVTMTYASVPSDNPIEGFFKGHGAYFDFDTNQQTNDPVAGDMYLDAFAIYGGQYLMHIEEVIGQLFEEQYPDGYISYHQFKDVTLDDVEFPNSVQGFTPYFGDVIVLKTDKNKVVKLIIIDRAREYDDPEAPSYRFLYLYDNIEDVTIPKITQVVLVTEDGIEHTLPTEGGELVFNVTSRPVELKFNFDEYVQPHDYPNYLNDIAIYFNVGDRPFDDCIVANIGSVIGLEPAQYVFEFTDNLEYYFQDLSGNMITERPFDQLTINYTQ